MTTPKQLGNQAETLAATYLQKQGLKILQRNLRTKYGEVDILAKDGNTLAIVEVKAKSSSCYGIAAEMITQKKQEKLLLLARELQLKYKWDSVRIDALCVDQASSIPIINYYKGALENNV